MADLVLHAGFSMFRGPAGRAALTASQRRPRDTPAPGLESRPPGRHRQQARHGHGNGPRSDRARSNAMASILHSCVRAGSIAISQHRPVSGGGACDLAALQPAVMPSPAVRPTANRSSFGDSSILSSSDPNRHAVCLLALSISYIACSPAISRRTYWLRIP
jgi:hypothetical protein